MGFILGYLIYVNSSYISRGTSGSPQTPRSPYSCSLSALYVDHSLEKSQEQQLFEFHSNIKTSIKDILICCDQLRQFEKEERKAYSFDFMIHFQNIRESLGKFIDLTNNLVSIMDLKQACANLIKFEKEIVREFLAGNTLAMDEFPQVVNEINLISIMHLALFH